MELNINLDQNSYKVILGNNILNTLNIFNEDEKDLICVAIWNHSDKSIVHGWLDEILKDADVMQHVLYNPLFDLKQQESERFNSLKKEFNLES